MKKLSSIIALFLLITAANAQHGIRLTDGRYVSSDSVLLGSTEVKYRSDSGFRSVPMEEVSWVRFENGTVYRLKEAPKEEEYVFQESASNAQPVYDTPESRYKKGKEDAAMYYDPKNVKVTTAALTSIPVPLLGLVSATACSLTPAKPDGQGVTDKKLLRDPQYRRGYSEGARPEKSRAAWKGFLVGGCIKLAGAFALAMAVSAN